MFDPANPALVGRRVKWSVWGRTYTGTIQKVIQDTNIYERGDWIVLPDGNTYTVVVIGDERKLI